MEPTNFAKELPNFAKELRSIREKVISDAEAKKTAEWEATVERTRNSYDVVKSILRKQAACSDSTTIGYLANALAEELGEPIASGVITEMIKEGGLAVSFGGGISWMEDPEPEPSAEDNKRFKGRLEKTYEAGHFREEGMGLYENGG